MEKTTAEAKAKDDDELQADGRAATGRSATRGDRRETADAVGQRTAKLPFAEESARGTADGNADGRRCFPQVRQGSAKFVRARVRTFAQMAAEDVRRYAPSAVKSCARLAGLLRKFRRWQIVAQAAVSQRRRRKRKRNCRRIVAAAAGCSAGRWRREMSGHELPVVCPPRIGCAVACTPRIGCTSGVTATESECSGVTATGWHTGGMGATD